MLTTAELTTIAHARIDDAAALLLMGRYDGAVYMAGYAVEIALKIRIVHELKLPGFPEGGEFKGREELKTHNLRRCYASAVGMLKLRRTSRQTGWWSASGIPSRGIGRRGT